jgi:hypothetical protein
MFKPTRRVDSMVLVFNLGLRERRYGFCSIVDEGVNIRTHLPSRPIDLVLSRRGAARRRTRIAPPGETSKRSMDVVVLKTGPRG